MYVYMYVRVYILLNRNVVLWVIFKFSRLVGMKFIIIVYLIFVNI